MSTVLSNVICAENALQKIKEEEVKKLLTEKNNVFKLGSISYELLYFYDAFSKTENTWIRSCADGIKLCKVNFFDMARKYISKADKNAKEILTSYVMGNAVHYLLNYRTSDYILHLTNDVTDRVALNKLFVEIDSCMCEVLNKNISQLTSFTALSENEITVIEEFYQYLISEIKKQLIPDNLLADCIQKLTKALSGKKSIFQSAGKEFNYKALPDKNNILNESHSVWSAPGNDEEKNNFSYLQLVNYAQNDAIRALPKLYTALLSGATQSCEFIFRNYK